MKQFCVELKKWNCSPANYNTYLLNNFFIQILYLFLPTTFKKSSILANKKYPVIISDNYKIIITA